VSEWVRERERERAKKERDKKIGKTKNRINWGGGNG